MVVVDENGKLLFSENDIGALSSKRGNTINEIFNIAQEINGLGEQQVENLKKN